MTGPLTPTLLTQPLSRYESPFTPGIDTFNDNWWIRNWRGQGDAFSFHVSGVEVARAHVLLAPPAASHVTVGRLPGSVELARLEVIGRLQRTEEKIGSRAVDLLARHYQGRDLWVHSNEEAECFYKRSGWEPFAREDGETSQDTFFVKFA